MNKLVKILTTLVTFAMANSVLANGTVTIVSPFAPGGGSDAVARTLQKTLITCMPNRTVVVETRTGASGEIAARYVAKNRDSTTILLASPIIVINNLKRNDYYNLETDLDPIMYIGHLPLILVTNTKNNWVTVEDLARSNKTLSYGSAGLGTNSHLSGFELSKVLNKEFVHVPYKGVGHTIPDLISGVLDFSFLFGSNVYSFIENNRLRALAVVGDQRNSQLPNVPTFKELGYTDFGFTTWFILLANSGADAMTIKEIKTCLQKTLSDTQESLPFREIGLQYNQRDFFRARQIMKNDTQRYRDFFQKNPSLTPM